MHTHTTQPDLVYRELNPDSRSFRLREMYWDKTHCEALVSRPITGSGEDTLSGHAEDFAALLEASDPFIQPDELIVGCCLAAPENKKSINLGYYNAHYPPGHATILNKGLKGIQDQAENQLQEQTDPERRDFLQSVVISYRAACNYIEKYADCAEKMAVQETETKRKAELNRIADVCRDLIIGPPSSFQAALQLVQFTRLFGGRGCIGRFDQWMYPFYKKDVDTGRITTEEAQELLECLFIKLNYFGDVGVGVNNDDLRNITLAGQTPEGKDACNALTYMCMAASTKLMLPEPKLNVRFFPGSPPRLMRESCRVLAKGTNVLAVYNDEVVIPAMSRLGIPIEDVRDYCNDGCSELILGGKSTIQFAVNDSLPILTETVLHSAEQPYQSFDDVMADFKHRLTRFMPEDREPNPAITFPYFAASIEDCLQEESTMGVRYSIKGSILAQTGDTADGLAAIKKLIYEDKVLTWDDYIAAIKADYEGYEPLRQMLRNRAPKFGNGNDYVDNIAKEITEYFCDGVHERAQNPPGHGNKRAAGLMCFGMHRKRNILASPDGRRQGDLTASSFSPAVGM
ncbi:MAG: pyruvate formate lyase family protein, partial [Candidatus Latescibacteria bacterium]|nr:pyruvate formate lyase family protein [Candidatus Latescibacterota bacterium]